MKVLLSLPLWVCLLHGQAADTEARAVLGFQQAGASAAKSKQDFFFDFFIDRKLASFRWSLWGDVRVASAPQQVSAPVGQLGITRALFQLPVNQLAESVEFSSGLDYHPWSWNLNGGATRRLGLIAYAGASSPSDPATNISIFQVPAAGSPQQAAFSTAFPQAAGAAYIGFVPPARFQFYRSWGAGIRLTTQYPGGAPPAATYTISAGQDEAVTGGRLHGTVGKIDVFYPLPLTIKQFRWIYLFGNAALRLGRARDFGPFDLAPAPAGVSGSDPDVAIVAVPANRDVYRIGIGVDAVALLCAIGPKLCN